MSASNPDYCRCCNICLCVWLSAWFLVCFLLQHCTTATVALLSSYCSLPLLATAQECLRVPATAVTACECLRLSAIVCDRLRLSATACDCLRLPATAFDCLRLPATACKCLRLFATVCDCLRLPATACDYLRLPATSFLPTIFTGWPEFAHIKTENLNYS